MTAAWQFLGWLALALLVLAVGTRTSSRRSHRGRHRGYVGLAILPWRREETP